MYMYIVSVIVYCVYKYKSHKYKSVNKSVYPVFTYSNDQNYRRQ